MNKLTKKERFEEKVLSRYHVYNSVFATLPYDLISDTGQLLPILTAMCKNGFKNKSQPLEIIDNFFSKHCEDYNKEERISLLFRFIQYIERQVVLFDAIEDASFREINNLDGVGTLRNLKEEFETNDNRDKLHKYLNSVCVRPVLTAHPTQFYPGSVLGIITDLSKAIKDNDLKNIKDLLSQLGKTPFYKSKKPTPFDEAVNLCWYLENVFYNSIADIFKYVKSNIYENDFKNFNLISLGFWPGGDRDGNPFVTTKNGTPKPAIIPKALDTVAKTIILGSKVAAIFLNAAKRIKEITRAAIGFKRCASRSIYEPKYPATAPSPAT